MRKHFVQVGIQLDTLGAFPVTLDLDPRRVCYRVVFIL